MNFIQISGWSTPRSLGSFEDDCLVIQIKAICDKCSACEGRVRYIKDRMRQIGIEGEWRNNDSVVSVPLPDIDEPAERGAQKEEWLSHFFGAPVRFVRWVSF